MASLPELKEARLHRPEEQFPDKPIPGNWQVIYHGSNFMSYDPDPSHYVNGSFIVWNLVDIVAKGGLFQIGYGPDRDGEFHPLAVAALHEAGDWLKVNGEAICASAAPSFCCVLPALALRVRAWQTTPARCRCTGTTPSPTSSATVRE